MRTNKSLESRIRAMETKIKDKQIKSFKPLNKQARVSNKNNYFGYEYCIIGKKSGVRQWVRNTHTFNKCMKQLFIGYGKTMWYIPSKSYYIVDLKTGTEIFSGEKYTIIR